MYIEPNTTIKILKNVPLDPTYDHTVWFDSEDEQPAWFNRFVKYELTEQSYQRTQRGYMRIRRKAEDLYDCNYIMYQNINFGNKWFYAFLTSVEYINNEVSEVRFEIDVMQTWWYDYRLEECFVEREHTRTDYIGENLVPENFELGDYINHPVAEFNSEMGGTPIIIVACSQRKDQGDWETAEGGMINGVYTGVEYYRCTSAAAANELLFDFTTDSKSDAVLSVFMMPTAFAPSEVPETGTNSITKHFGSMPQVIYNDIRHSLDSYTPRNKKLLTGQFNFLTIVNSDGESNRYQYEYFTDKSDINFKIEGVINVTPEYQVVPQEYKHISNNMLEALRLNSSIQCAYTIDSFRAYIAQRKYPLGMAYQGAVAGLASQAITAGMTSGITGSVLGKHSSSFMALKNAGALDNGISERTVGGSLAAIGGIVAQVRQSMELPDSVRGTNTNVLSVASGWYGFHAYMTQIRPEFAKIIDDYFDRFGYACHRNKVPERHVRGSWTYTKTIGCTITGSIPADDAVRICNIYNNGITFWVHTKTVGDYSQDNSPLGGGD